MLGKIIVLATLAASIVLLFLFQTTNPSSAGPGGILVVFLLMYVIFFGVVVFALRAGSIVIVQSTKHIVVKKPLHEISMSHATYLASIVAIAPIMLIGMSSVGGLKFYEVGLVVVFVALGVFYVQKRLR